MKIALVALFLVASAPAAFAKGAKAKYHCVGSDGAEMTSATTKKECKKAGGKWEKMKMTKKGGGTGDTASPEGKTEPKQQ